MIKIRFESVVLAVSFASVALGLNFLCVYFWILPLPIFLRILGIAIVFFIQVLGILFLAVGYKKMTMNVRSDIRKIDRFYSAIVGGYVIGAIIPWVAFLSEGG